jgi:hypothetical protein
MLYRRADVTPSHEIAKTFKWQDVSRNHGVPTKPVLAREREARWKEESFPNTILLCTTHLQNNVQIPSKNVHILHKRDIHEASELENSPQRPQSGPQSPLGVTPMLQKWAKVISESARSDSRRSQNEPKCSQVVPQGLPRPPKIDQKRSPRPSRDTFKKINVSALREPHYLLCFWNSLLRTPHYSLCF